MFWNLYRYRMKRLLMNKTLIFWAGLFPIMLGTFFGLTFSNISSKTEDMEKIDVAIVNDGTYENSEMLNSFLEQMTANDGYLNAKNVSMKEAKQLLNKKKVEGIIEISNDISVIINDNGMNQTILKSMIDSYLQTENAIQNVIADKPQRINDMTQALFAEKEYNEEKPIASGNMDPYVQYYFALFAMTCMFGATFGLTNTMEIQANQTVVAIRRNVCPTKKMLAVITDFLAALTIQFALFIIVFLYLKYIMKIDFGSGYGLILLAGFVSSMVGIAYGYFIGVLVKSSESTKNGIISATVLLMCFLSGLMVGNMKNMIEKTAPIINKINPAAVISDSFYSVCVTGGMQMYIRCIVTLLVYTLVFGVFSVVVLRREKYADI